MKLARSLSNWLLSIDTVGYLKTILGWRVIAFICALLVLIGWIIGVATTYNLALAILAAKS